ncbi:MAG: hypothetical protein WCX63_02230 [Methanoregula sp.]
MSAKAPFICPKCGHEDMIFHEICPECGRLFFRDYIDTRVYPKDPDLAGVCTSKFWTWIFLLLILGGIFMGILSLFGIIR